MSCSLCGGRGTVTREGDMCDYEATCHVCGGSGQSVYERSAWSERNQSGERKCRFCSRWTTNPCETADGADWCHHS